MRRTKRGSSFLLWLLINLLLNNENHAIVAWFKIG